MAWIFLFPTPNSFFPMGLLSYWVFLCMFKPLKPLAYFWANRLTCLESLHFNIFVRVPFRTPRNPHAPPRNYHNIHHYSFWENVFLFLLWKNAFVFVFVDSQNFQTRPTLHRILLIFYFQFYLQFFYIANFQEFMLNDKILCLKMNIYICI
jgi:hypothetical protein